MFYCLECLVGGTEINCWFCDGPMVGGNFKLLPYRFDVSMLAAVTRFQPNDPVELKTMDGLRIDHLQLCW